MPAASLLRPGLPALWPALRAFLALKTGVPEDRVLLQKAKKRPPPHLTADRDLVVKVGGPNPDQGLVHGGGRVNTQLVRLLTVTVRSRCELGEVDRDDVALTHPDLGHWVLEEKVIDALQLFDEADPVANLYLVYPLHLEQSGQAEEEVPDELDWTVSSMNFRMCYLANLDQSRQ